MKAWPLAGAALIGVAAGAAAMALAGHGSAISAPADRAGIEAVVRDYILAHPEIIPEAMARLEDIRTAKAIADNRAALETPFAGAWAGNARGDVTLVEFTDYACGFCRSSVADVDRLLAEDQDLRVVYREIAILSPESVAAGEAALAAAKAGRHGAFHRALFAAGPLSPESVAATGQAVGVPTAAARDPALARELDGNLALARAIRLGGTPTFLVGDRSFTGRVGYATLKQAIAEARAKG